MFLFCFVLFCLFCLFTAAPMAYGGSHARGPIRAAAASLHQSHSNAGSEHVCSLHHSWGQRQILNPLSEARDRTCTLMVPRRIHFCAPRWELRVCVVDKPPRSVVFLFQQPALRQTASFITAETPTLKPVFLARGSSSRGLFCAAVLLTFLTTGFLSQV